jgi:hypothetical protein
MILGVLGAIASIAEVDSNEEAGNIRSVGITTFLSRQLFE